MKNLIFSLTLILIGCSSPVDGLWVEKNENALLKFYKDSVINNSLQIGVFRDTLKYKMTKDSITWFGLNPELNNGKSYNTFKYLLVGDSLQIWYKPNNKFVYFKSNADNYLEHFLRKGDLDIKLPTSENARPTLRQYQSLNIKMGFKGDQVKIFVQDVETSPYELNKEIKRFKDNEELNYVGTQNIICQLFIDETVTSEYTFWLLDYLRVNDIRRINFITRTTDYNHYTSDFWGLTIAIPSTKINWVEEKNER